MVVTCGLPELLKEISTELPAPTSGDMGLPSPRQVLLGTVLFHFLALDIFTCRPRSQRPAQMFQLREQHPSGPEIGKRQNKEKTLTSAGNTGRFLRGGQTLLVLVAQLRVACFAVSPRCYVYNTIIVLGVIVA